MLLGAALFADKRLSADGTVSCASCHMADRAFGDGKPVSEGIKQQASTRNAPSLLNVGYHTSFFWDGRRASLEDQVLDPLLSPVEHGLRDLEQVIEIVSSDERYARGFEIALLNEGVAERGIRIALATFVRSLDPGPSRLDRYLSGSDKSLLSEPERRGMELFKGRAGCATCHTMQPATPSFTDNDFHALNVGTPMSASLASSVARSLAAPPSTREALIGSDRALAALGRFNVTQRLRDIGKYRTPSLRNVAITAPYMHDGSVATLDEAVELEIYYRSATQTRPLILTAQERRDLVSFLKALTAESLEKVQGTQ